jgi:hypothetical protein
MYRTGVNISPSALYWLRCENSLPAGGLEQRVDGLYNQPHTKGLAQAVAEPKIQIGLFSDGRGGPRIFNDRRAKRGNPERSEGLIPSRPNHGRDSFIVLPQPFGSIPEILPGRPLGQGGSHRPCKGLTLSVRTLRARDTGLVSSGK